MRATPAGVHFQGPEANLRRRCAPRSRPRGGRTTKRGGRQAAGLAAGAWRTRGCRSTTCTGRPPWWWRRRGGKQGGGGSGRACRRARLAARRRHRRHQRKPQALRRDLRARERGQGQDRARAELRVRPGVQGTAVVLENKTGRVLAMAGGFSYPLSQLNRATQAHAPAGLGDQAAELSGGARERAAAQYACPDASITLPPIGGGRGEDYWSPKNYEGGGRELDAAPGAGEFAQSRHRASARRRHRGQARASLDRLCELALEAQIYRECERYYPFVLGAQPVRPIDLAAFYATIANEGARPAPYVVESIEQDGMIYRRADGAGANQRRRPRRLLPAQDHAAGRPGARNRALMAPLAPYVAGKTGTSEEENDTWFVGFTNDITVAVWVGYDNADGKRRTLGGGAPGRALRCRSSNRSSRRPGATAPARRRWLRRRRRPGRRCHAMRRRRTAANRAGGHPRTNACGSTPTAVRWMRATAWSPATAPRRGILRRTTAFRRDPLPGDSGANPAAPRPTAAPAAPAAGLAAGAASGIGEPGTFAPAREPPHAEGY